MVSGITGSETYLFFVVNAQYNDPFGGGTKTGPALLTQPVPVTPSANTIQINLPDLGGVGPVEVYNAAGDQAQIVDGTFVDGTWYVWVWAGAITEGTGFVKAHSGIFSEAIEFSVGLAPPPPGP